MENIKGYTEVARHWGITTNEHIIVLINSYEKKKPL